MSTLEDKVEEVVKSFIDSNVLLTALDVSNEVKKTFPLSRHREVRDIVRVLFTNVMVSAGYGKTQINVKLADGTPQEAMLYHHLSDSWDLDTKYDDQKRAQSVVRAAAPVPSTLVSTGVVGGGTVQTALANAVAAKVANAVSANPAPPVTPHKTAPATDIAKVWDELFDGVKLFP